MNKELNRNDPAFMPVGCSALLGYLKFPSPCECEVFLRANRYVADTLLYQNPCSEIDMLHTLENGCHLMLNRGKTKWSYEQVSTALRLWIELGRLNPVTLRYKIRWGEMEASPELLLLLDLSWSLFVECFVSPNVSGHLPPPCGG